MIPNLLLFEWNCRTLELIFDYYDGMKAKVEWDEFECCCNIKDKIFTNLLILYQWEFSLAKVLNYTVSECYSVSKIERTNQLFSSLPKYFCNYNYCVNYEYCDLNEVITTSFIQFAGDTCKFIRMPNPNILFFRFTQEKQQERKPN